MQQMDMALAKSAIRDHSEESSSIKWPGREGRDEIARIVVKLLSMYPRVPDPSITVEAYVQELGAIPCFWVRKACRSITERPKEQQNWLPLVGDIKTEAAKLHAEYRNRAQHGLPYDPTAIHRRLAVGREIHLMKQGPVPVDRQLGSGKEGER